MTVYRVEPACERERKGTPDQGIDGPGSSSAGLIGRTEMDMPGFSQIFWIYLVFDRHVLKK